MPISFFLFIRRRRPASRQMAYATTHTRPQIFRPKKRALLGTPPLHRRRRARSRHATHQKDISSQKYIPMPRAASFLSLKGLPPHATPCCFETCHFQDDFGRAASYYELRDFAPRRHIRQSRASRLATTFPDCFLFHSYALRAALESYAAHAIFRRFFL